jgi:hypothetical protein
MLSVQGVHFTLYPRPDDDDDDDDDDDGHPHLLSTSSTTTTTTMVTVIAIVPRALIILPVARSNQLISHQWSFIGRRPLHFLPRNFGT